jgi:hypothetical protein
MRPTGAVKQDGGVSDRQGGSSFNEQISAFILPKSDDTGNASIALVSMGGGLIVLINLDRSISKTIWKNSPSDFHQLLIYIYTFIV